MTSNNPLDVHWGAKKAARYDRRRWIIAGAGLIVSVALGFIGRFTVPVGRYIAPEGDAADAGSLVWAGCLLTAIVIFARLIWREIDEVSRRIVINAAAVAGFASIVALLLMQAGGRLLHLTDPMFAVLMTTMLAMLAAVVVQRLRG